MSDVRATLTLKPIKHSHYQTYADWRVEAERRGFTIAQSGHDKPFQFNIALSPGGRFVGACFLEGIDFGWLRD